MKKKNKSGGAAAIMAVCVFIHMLMLSAVTGKACGSSLRKGRIIWRASVWCWTRGTEA